MEPLTLLLTLAVLALLLVWAVRLIVKRTGPDNREFGIEDDLQQPEASDLEADAAGEPALGGEPAPSESPADDATTRLQARRAAGVSEEDLDY